MARWTYSDYESYTGTAKVARLALHIREVADLISVNTNSDGNAVDYSALNQYLQGLKSEKKELEATAGVSAGGISLIRRGRP